MKGERVKTSWVWKHVIINNDKTMNCQLCKDENKFHEFKCGGPSKNTTNIGRHLNSHHLVQALETKKLHDIEKAKKEEHAKLNANHSKLHQMQLKEFINQKNKNKPKLSLKDPRNQEFHQILGEFIIGSNISINTLDNPFFQYFLYRYVPIYTVPSRTYFSTKIIPNMEKNIESKIQNILSICNYLSLTSDIWTAPHALTSYISLTLHCVDLNFQKHTAVLDCKPMPQAHTGDNISEALNNMCISHKIPGEKVFVMVTDNASVMLNGVKGAGMDSVGCILHTLHLIIKHSIFVQEGVNNMLHKIKEIVKLHKKSSTERQLFENINIEDETVDTSNYRLVQV